MATNDNDDLGFSWLETKGGEIIIKHHGRLATTLRGNRATEFRDEIDSLSFGDQQQWLARLTGNYKHGNERQARNHPRNR